MPSSTALLSVFHRFCWDMAADSAPFWEKLGNKSYSCLHAEAHGKILAHFHLNSIEKNGKEEDALRHMWSGFFFLPSVSWRFETDVNCFHGDNHVSFIQSQTINISFNTWFLSLYNNLPAGTQIHTNPGESNHRLASLLWEGNLSYTKILTRCWQELSVSNYAELKDEKSALKPGTVFSRPKGTTY